MAEALALNFRNTMRENVNTKYVTSPLERKQAFMNRMLKHWFMHPFSTPNNSAIKIGKENETLTLKVLQNYLRSFSNNTFRGGKIRVYGLLANKRIRSCATSPDGVMPLY